MAEVVLSEHRNTTSSGHLTKLTTTVADGEATGVGTENTVHVHGSSTYSSGNDDKNRRHGLSTSRPGSTTRRKGSRFLTGETSTSGTTTSSNNNNNNNNNKSSSNHLMNLARRRRISNTTGGKMTMNKRNKKSSSNTVSPAGPASPKESTPNATPPGRRGVAASGSSSSRTQRQRFTSVLTQPFPYWNALEEMFGDFMAEEWNPAQRSCIIGSLIRFFELKIMLAEYTANQLLAPTQLIAHAWHVLLLETQTYKSVLYYIQDFHAVRPHRLLHHALLRRHEFKEYQVRLERTQRLFETYYGPGVKMPATLEAIPHQDKQFVEDGVLGSGVVDAAAGGQEKGATEAFWGDITGSTTDHLRAGLSSAVAGAAAAATGLAQTPPTPTGGYWCGSGICTTVGCTGAGSSAIVNDDDDDDAYFTFATRTQVTPPSSSASDDMMDASDVDAFDDNNNGAGDRCSTARNNKNDKVNNGTSMWISSCLPDFDCFNSIRSDFWCVRNAAPCFENQEIAVEDENISILTPPDLVDDADIHQHRDQEVF